MMSMNLKKQEFFVAGGTLRYDAPSYVEREADRQLQEFTAAGELCYVLTTRQMGKSSLMVRTEVHLQKRNIQTVSIDLTSIGTAQIDAWFLSVLDDVQSQLSLLTDVEEWWEENRSLSQVKRFTKFAQEVIPNELDGQVIIFIDEIDSMLDLDFADDFFAAIRSIYNQGALLPTGPRVSFVLLGVAAPNDLIKDQTRTPFNIGTRIQLDELTLAEAQVLVQGLPKQKKAILDRIFYWTNGHPYLTQAIGLKISKQGEREWSDSAIDELVEHLFLTDEAAVKETNLQFVRNRIISSKNKNELLSLYRKVYGGKTIANNEQSLYQNELKLYGLLGVDEKGHLVIRNRIYRRVFNLDWIKENSPANRWRAAAIAAVIISILVFLGGYFFFKQTPETGEVLAQLHIEDFKNTTNPTLRLDSLAKLFSLDGYREEGLRLFNDLILEEKTALFEVVTPPEEDPPVAIKTEPSLGGVTDFPESTLTLEPTATALLTPVSEYAVLLPQIQRVAQETYQTLYAEDLHQAQGTTRLLQAMKAALEQGQDAESRALHDEIDIWLEARAYAAQEDYASAKTTYDLAIRFGADNPAIYLERALTSALLLEYEAAIDDLIIVWGSGSNWEQPVLNVLRRDEQLQEAAWNMDITPPFIEQVPIPPSPQVEMAQDVNPSGQIVFVSDRNSNDDIYVMDSDGTNTIRLTDNTSRDWVPSWSSDGERIVFTSDRDGDMELYVMDHDGSNVIQLTDNERFDCCAKWSPDNIKIVFNANGLDGPQDIFVMNADGSDIINLTNHPGEEWNSTWSPDGKKIAFNSGRTGQRDIYVINVDGTGLQNLTNHPEQDIAPNWSPDGKYISFYSDREGNHEIFVMETDGSNPINLTNHPGSDHWPNWSPDGGWITFTTYRHGLPEIYIMKADGSNQIRLTNNEFEDSGSRWSP